MKPKDMHILLVEDNPADFVLIEEYLIDALENPCITHARSYSEARIKLEEDPAFNLILLDLSLPDLSGEKLVQQMMQISRQIPVVVLTGCENEDFGLKSLSMGVTDYVLKDEISSFILGKIIAFSSERNRINKAIRESEKKYKDIFNLSPHPMWVFDSDTLKFIDVNLAAIQRYEYSRDEFLSMTLLDIRPEEEIQFTKKKIEQFNSDPNFSFKDDEEVKHRSKSGKIIDVEIKTIRLEENENQVMVVAEDITHKLKAERAIARKSKLMAVSAEVSSELLKTEDALATLDKTFSEIGKAVEVDRLYYFEKHIDPHSGKKLISQKLEWTAYDVESQIDNPELQNIEFDHLPDFMSPLLDNEVYKAIVSKLPEGATKDLLISQSIKSIIVLPVFAGSNFHGFIGFDDCKNERVWEKEELQYLQTIASNISSSTKLRMANDELELSERRFKALVQEGSDLIGIVNDEFKFTYISPSVGGNYEEYIGLDYLDHIHPADLERIKNSLQNISELKRIELSPYRLKDYNGNFHWVETIITNLLDEPAIQGYVLNSRNVTEQIVKQKELRQSLERYDIVSKATSDTIWDLDLETDQMQYNDNISIMFGYKKTEVEEVRTWWRNKIHPEDLQKVDDTLMEVLNSGRERFQIQYRFKTADGSYKHIFDRAFVIKDENGKALRMIGAMQDISHEVEEEERLKLLESVITNTSESVVILRAEPGEYGREIVYVNEAFTKLTGYQSKEVIGETLHFLNGADTDKKTRQELKIAMQEYRAIEVEFINYRKNGDKFWINTSMVPVSNKKGKYTHWVAIGRDITEQKKNEEEIQGSLAEKEILLSEIHHRVKNNLAVVSGMMQLQAYESDNEELQAKLFDSVFRIKTMATVHEILYQSRSFSKLEFSDTMKKLVETISDTLQKNTDIKVDIHCDVIRLNINQAIPASLIVNEVLTNTYKHAFQDRVSGKIYFNLYELNGKVVIEICDNGVGFPSDFRLKENNSLGIHLIQVLSEQINATYNYENGETGTHFTLEFERIEQNTGIGSDKVH